MESYVYVIIVACFIFSVGGAMQKHGMATSFPKLSGSAIIKEWRKILATIFKNWVWVTGTILVFVGWIFHFQALGMGDISIVQPLLNIQIIMIVLIGVLVLKEKVKAFEFVGLAILFGGAMILSFSSHEKAAKTMTEWVLWVVVIACFAVVGLISLFLNRKKGSALFEIGLAVIGALLVSLNSIFMNATTIVVQRGRGSFNLSTLSDWIRVLSTPYFLGVIVIGISCTVIIQWAYTHGRVSIIAPVLNTVQMIIPIIAGPLIFAEVISPVRIGGIVVITIGTLVLGQKAGAG